MTNDLLHSSRSGTTLAVVGVFASLAFYGCSNTTSADGASSAGGHDATSASPAEGVTAAKESPSGYEIIGESPQGSLEPGRYALAPIGPVEGPLAVVDVPVGFSSWESFIYRDEPVVPDEPLEIGLWDITGVYLNPCQMSNEVPTKSVREIASAFGRQRLTSVTKPRAVDVAGYHGLYMEVATPTDLTVSTCEDYELNLWEGRPDGGFWTTYAGLIVKLWILDVDGQPMVIHMAVPPPAKSPQIQEMTHVVLSTTFEPN